MIHAFGTVLALTDEEIQSATVPPITFVVTAVLAVAIILLGLDLVRRVRRAHYREEIQQQLEAEIAEREAREATGAPGSAADETGGASAAGVGPDTELSVDPDPDSDEPGRD